MSTDTRTPSLRWPIVACALIALATMIWPSDTQWAGDERALIANARAANANWRLADAGLRGTVGLAYGPMPTQFYQLLLILCRDRVPAVVCMHAFAFVAATAAALLWLTRTLRWSPWLAVLPLLSPFYWYYARTLWDNPFALPIGATMLAGYAAFLRSGRRGPFLVAFACAITLPLIHMMTLPLVGAVVSHALWSHRRAFRTNVVGIGVIVCILLGLNARYLWSFDWSTLYGIAQRPVDDVIMRAAPRSTALLFPLLSGRLMSAIHFIDERGYEPGLQTTSIVNAVRWTTVVAYVLFCVGLATLCIGLVRRRLRHDPAIHALAVICLIAFAAQVVMLVATRAIPPAHYYCGSWPAAVFCLWVGLRTLARIRLATPLALFLATALVVCTAAFAIDIHRAGRGVVWHGPTYRVSPGPVLRSDQQVAPPTTGEVQAGEPVDE